MSQFNKVKWWQKIIYWPVRQLQQAVGSLGDMIRTPISSFMTILVLGISLTLPATLHLFVKNAKQVSAQWESASQISIFLKSGITEAQAQNVVQLISLYPEVASVRYISANDALAEFKQQSGFGDALSYLDSNPLPATILVVPLDRYSQPEATKQLLAKLEQERGVDHGKLDLEWLTRLEAMLTLIEDIVLALALLLCLSVILIIGNTIRLAILNQKDAIAVMKLVGATDGFIQRPFLYTGIWYGVFGGVFSCLVVMLLAEYLSLAMVQLAELYQSKFVLAGLTIVEMSYVLLSAMFLGLAGSYLSVKQHIRDIEPNAD
jgi:cell division transport system permease protein